MTDRVIRVVMDASGVERGSRRAGAALRRVDQRSRTLAAGFTAVRRAATGLFAVLGAREIIQTANTFAQLQNQLRVVTDSTEDLNAANERLFEIATATRAPIEATVNLFSRASIAAGELGASQEELFRLTEITGQALAVQGGAASEASGALRQLSQSFSSGIVRAEEFNSILEGAFPLAQAAARGLDEAAGSVGKLRNLVVEGEVTSREFFNAILKGGEALGEQFGQTVPTVSQALTNLQTSFIGLIGQLDASGNFTERLAQSILDLADGLGTFGDAITGVLAPGEELSENMERIAIAAILVGSTFQGLFDLMAVLRQAFVDFGESLGAIAAATAQAVKGNFSEAIAILNEPAFEGTQAAFTDFFESLDENVRETSDLITGILIPSFRTVREESEAIAEGGPPPIVDPNAAEDVRDATDAADEFLTALENQRVELELQRDLGDEADEAIVRYREDLELAAAANDAFGDLVPTQEVMDLTAAFIEQATAGVEAQRALREEIEAAELAATFDEQIEALEEEIALLGADNEALAVNAELRALAAGATEEQAAKIRELTQTLLDEKAELDDQLPTLQDFFDDVSETAETTLAGIIADPLQEGLDELPFKFAQLLQQLAAEALAAEVFEILGNLGGGGGGGGGFIGTALGFIGGLFGGAQAGGPVTGGQPVLVGERGPEIFTPPGSGNITPNVNINQAAQAPPMVNVVNVSDPADIPSGIETPEGEQAVINIIQRNPEAVRRLLG